MSQRQPNSRAITFCSLLTIMNSVSGIPVNPGTAVDEGHGGRRLSAYDRFLQTCDNYAASYGDHYCPPQASMTCGPQFAPSSQAQTSLAKTVAADLTDTMKAFWKIADPLPSAMSTLFKLPFQFYGNSNKNSAGQQEFVQALAQAAQMYVAQEVQTLELEDLYAGILGVQAMFTQTNRSYGDYVLDPNSSDTQQNLQSQMTTTINTLLNEYPAYATATPWTDPTQPAQNAKGEAYGSNGFGIYYAVFTTLLLNANAQQIAYYGTDNQASGTAQINVVDYAWRGMAHAKELAKGYANMRQGYISGPSMTYHSNSFGGYCNPPTIDLNDKFPIYNGASASPSSVCSWSVSTVAGSTIGTNMYSCSTCPQSTLDTMNTAMDNCKEARLTAVTAPVLSNWEQWVLEPAAQWGALSDQICEAATLQNVKAYCSKKPSSAADAMRYELSDPKLVPYKVQQTCQSNYPGAAVVAVNTACVAGGCNNYFHASGIWLDQCNAGADEYTCCLQAGSSPICPDGWTHVTEWSTNEFCGASGSTTDCCEAPGTYTGSCAKFSNFEGYTMEQKQAWAAQCGATFTPY